MAFELPHCARCRVSIAAGQNVVFRDDGRVQHVQCPTVSCPSCQRPILLGQPMRRSGDELLHGSCWIKRRRAALASAPVEPITMILAKLKLGALPRLAASKTWVGPGTSRPCSGCDARIPPREMEDEVDVEGQTLRFHRDCFAIWQREVAQGRRVSGGSASSSWRVLFDRGGARRYTLDAGAVDDLLAAFQETRFEASVNRAASRALRARARALQLRASVLADSCAVRPARPEHLQPRRPLALL